MVIETALFRLVVNFVHVLKRSKDLNISNILSF